MIMRVSAQGQAYGYLDAREAGQRGTNAALPKGEGHGDGNKSYFSEIILRPLLAQVPIHTVFHIKKKTSLNLPA
jgi:hypothetical protein